MISGKDIYAVWAPNDSIWSNWVSPSLFAQIECSETPPSPVSSFPSIDWAKSGGSAPAAVMIDLPGAESVQYGFALAKLGYRPVLVNNASPAPSRPGGHTGSATVATYNIQGLASQICALTHVLRDLNLPPTPPPAFILDAKRLEGEQTPLLVPFDNRWMVFPQDFPTAKILSDRGIKQVVLAQKVVSQPQNDLGDVLIGWQRSGIEILAVRAESQGMPEKITVRVRNRFDHFIEKMLASLGLRQRSVGGFGSSVSDFIHAG